MLLRFHDLPIICYRGGSLRGRRALARPRRPLPRARPRAWATGLDGPSVTCLPPRARPALLPLPLARPPRPLVRPPRPRPRPCVDIESAHNYVNKYSCMFW